MDTHEGQTLCRGCGVEVVQGPRTRNPKKWCSGSCRARWYRKNSGSYSNRLSDLASQTMRRNASLSDGQCAHCGAVTPRTAKGRPKKYCSDSCGKKFRNRGSYVSSVLCSIDGCCRPSHARGVCGSHYSAVWRSENPDKYTAKNLRYRAQKKHDGAEVFSRNDVMEASDWSCGICGGAIERDCEYPNPLYGTVDHIVPLSRGGTHTIDNVQAAHHVCNSTKRDQLDFSLVR